MAVSQKSNSKYCCRYCFNCPIHVLVMLKCWCGYLNIFFYKQLLFLVQKIYWSKNNILKYEILFFYATQIIRIG